MGIAARAAPLAHELHTRRAAIEARREADQARLVLHLRGIARGLVREASAAAVDRVAEVLLDPSLPLVLDDLERTADAERTRLRAISVLEGLRDPARRVQALERRHTDALARISRFGTELERLDSEAFRWLRDRHRRRARKPTRSERFVRAVTFARVREQRAEAVLRESLGTDGFDGVAVAFERAEKGLRRAEAEAERVAHTRAMLLDLVDEHTDLQERVRTEPDRRLRALRSAVEERLVRAHLEVLVPRAPENLRPAVAEAHAVEVRLRGWLDLTSALDQALHALDRLGSEAWTATDPEALASRLAPYAALPAAVDQVVDVLAAFHDFDRWRAALEAGEGATCWNLLAGEAAGAVSPEVLGQLIPQLLTRPICSRRGPSSPP